jgi:hypothetical protein
MALPKTFKIIGHRCSVVKRVVKDECYKHVKQITVSCAPNSCCGGPYGLEFTATEADIKTLIANTKTIEKAQEEARKDKPFSNYGQKIYWATSWKLRLLSTIPLKKSKFFHVGDTVEEFGDFFLPKDHVLLWSYNEGMFISKHNGKYFYLNSKGVDRECVLPKDEQEYCLIPKDKIDKDWFEIEMAWHERKELR